MQGTVRFSMMQSGLTSQNSASHHGRLVDAGHGEVLYDAVGLDIAKQRELAPCAVVKGHLLSRHDDVGRDAHRPEFLDGVLGGLGLLLSRRGNVRHKRDMDIKTILTPDLSSYLSHRFEEGLALDVADGAADLRHHDVRARLAAHGVDVVLDGARHMRDDLHRLAEILPSALAAQHIPIHLARGEVGEAVEVLVDEPLVMPEVEVGLGAVLGDEHLAVLTGAHRAGIDIDIGVELLRRHLEPARFHQPAEGRHDDALPESGDHSARHKNILGHTLLLCAAPAPPSL